MIDTTKLISLDKSYRTRDGREVRLLAVNIKSDWPVVGAIKEKHGKETICVWAVNGIPSYMGNPEDTLIEVRPRHKRTVWINFNAADGGPEIDGIFDCREMADEGAEDDSTIVRIACLRIELDFEEGTFDE